MHANCPIPAALPPAAVETENGAHLVVTADALIHLYRNGPAVRGSELTPETARELAAHLLAAADHCESEGPAHAVRWHEWHDERDAEVRKRWAEREAGR